MAGKILRAAHLEMCPKCNLHGKIVFSNGSVSAKVFSQTEAEVELAKALAAGLLMPVEIPELRRQIEEHLPPQEVADALMDVAEMVVSEELHGEPEMDEIPGNPRLGRTHPICDN